jgi:hypothetical protein
MWLAGKAPSQRPFNRTSLMNTTHDAVRVMHKSIGMYRHRCFIRCRCDKETARKLRQTRMSRGKKRPPFLKSGTSSPHRHIMVDAF